MSDIVRAWKDESYRQSLSVEEQGMLPANPAGEIELTDTELETVYGAFSGGFGGFNAEDNRQWNFSGGFFVEDFSCNKISGGGEFEPGSGFGPGGGGGSGSRGGGIAGRIINRNTNTATSNSTSTATGGTATATVGPISIPLVSI